MINNWSRRHDLDHRYMRAAQRFSEISSGAGVPGKQDARIKLVEAFLKVAESTATGDTRVLGERLPALLEAERHLILFLPSTRAAEMIADVRTDIANMVYDTRRATLSNRVDEASRDVGKNEDWRAVIFAVKSEVNQIILQGYKFRERQRDAILLVGFILFVVTLFALTAAMFANCLPFTIKSGGATVTAGTALLIGFLSGAVGACISALFNVTVHGAVRGEFETAGVTAIRPLIGGVTGMLAVLLVATGMISFGENAIAAIAVASFILGFSEQLVIRSVETLSTRIGASGAGAATSPAGTDSVAPAVGATSRTKPASGDAGSRGNG